MIFNTRRGGVPLLLIGSLAVLSMSLYAQPISRPSLPSWVGTDYGDPVFHTAEDAQAFKETLRGVTLGAPLQNPDGFHNLGIYDVKYQPYEEECKKAHKPKQELILKILDGVDDNAIGEVKALKRIKQFVAAGKLRDPKLSSRPLVPSSKIVIIIVKQPGTPLHRSEIWAKADDKARQKMQEDVLEKMCEEVADVAVTSLILHDDNNRGNILVTFAGGTSTVRSIKLVDYGHATYTLRQESTNKADVIKYCKEQHGNYWKNNPAWRLLKKVGP